MKNASPRVQKWILEIDDLDFEIVSNTGADALRRIYEQEEQEIPKKRTEVESRDA